MNESSQHVTTKISQKSFTTNPWTTCTGLKASKLKHAASRGLAGRQRSQTQRSSVGMFWVQYERQSRIRLGQTAQEPRVTLGWKRSLRTLYLWTCLNHSSVICQSIIYRVGTMLKASENFSKYHCISTLERSFLQLSDWTLHPVEVDHQSLDCKEFR